MEIKQIHQIRKYVDIVIRRKALIAGFILLGAAVGLAFYLSQPKIYRATTLLSYQQQKINPARMSPDEQARIRDIVSTLTQIVTSNSSLERIIDSLGMHQEAKQVFPIEDIIAKVRSNIEITPAGRGDTFSITYTGSQPKEVARVANAIASKFIEENMKYREEKASETFSYTSNELEMAKEILDSKEAVMRDYKLKYFNEMPEQRANNMARLSALQQQYQDRQDSIQDMERTRVLVQDQIAAQKRIAEENARLRRALINPGPAAAQAPETKEEKIERLNNELTLLLDRYTEKHPEIRRIKKQIAHLKQTVDSESENKPKDEGLRETEQFNQNLFELQIQLKEIGLNIKRLNKEKADLQVLIEKYDKWVEAAPVRGAEWSALTREYGELKRHYDFLVAQNLQARSALNLERKQKGSQFKIEDPAREPRYPVKPDFMKIMAMALLAGTGIGIGLALAREIVDSSFRDPSDLEDFLGVEVICSVPRLFLKKERAKRLAVNIAGYFLFFACSIALLFAFAYYYRLGEIVI